MRVHLRMVNRGRCTQVGELTGDDCAHSLMCRDLEQIHVRVRSHRVDSCTARDEAVYLPEIVLCHGGTCPFLEGIVAHTWLDSAQVQ